MKIAIFGRPGGGKSTLAVEVATSTGLPLHQLDLLQYEQDGARVPDEVFTKRHQDVLATDRWVIEGFGSLQTFPALLCEANILIYVERPTLVHYWWVTKRFLLSPLRAPLGWPKGSPLLKSTISSFRFLRLSGRFWNSAFRARLHAMGAEKQVYVIRRKTDADTLLDKLRHREVLL
jgi:adenylate kinase family enzyme